MKRRPQKKLNYRGRVPSRADAHRFHGPVQLSSSRRRDGRRAADSCNHRVSDWITCKEGPPNAPSSGHFIRIHLMEARGLRRRIGAARAVNALANVLAGAFPLSWAGSPAQQFVVLRPGRTIVPAWTSRTTVWRPAPARVSPTSARSSFGPSPLEDRSESGCVGLG